MAHRSVPRRARGHRVLSCRAAESEARLSYAALGDLFDFELPDLPTPQQRALDAALLRAEVEGAPPDQRAVSVASLGVLGALAASGPVIIAIDDVQWLDAPSARVLAFVVRRLEDAPIRLLVALRLGSGGDPLGLGQTGLAPSLHRVSIGPLREEAMTRLLRARIGGDLARPVLLGLHRISGGNPLFALEIARALTGQGIRPAPGEPLPAHEHLAWVGIYRGDLAFAKHASASRQWARRLTDPAIRAESLSTFVMVEFLSGRVEPVRRSPAARRTTTRA